MTAAPLPAGFTAWVYPTDETLSSFPVPVAAPSIRARNLRALIAASGELGHSAAALRLFSATPEGGAGPLLADLTAISPPDGATEVNIWAARVEPAPAAGGGGAAAPAAVHGGGAAAVGGAGVPDIAAGLESLRLSVDALRREAAVKTGVFSEVTSTAALDFATKAGFHQRGRIPLPASLAGFGTVTAVPFPWRSLTEPQAFPTLRPLLQQWASTGATPAVDVCFVNTETLTRAPLVAEHETARYTGVPDLVTLWQGLGEDTVTTWTDAATSWDWKRQTVFTGDRKKVAAQAVLQVAAFARLSPDETSIPVFFTDMATGVRCWIMVAGTIYTFHKDGGADLTLEQGIRLFRYFIASNGRLLPRDTPLAAAAGATGGASGGGGGGGGAAGRGPFTPGPKRGGGGGSGGKGASPYRDALLGKGHSAVGGGREAVGSTLQSRKSSPGDPSWTRADELASFQMELAAAAAVLQRCGVDLTGVFDPSE